MQAGVPVVRHPLGFREVPLLRLGRLRIVVHVWDAGAGDPDVHNHRFRFASLVLRGTLAESRFRLGPGATHQLWECPAGCRHHGGAGITPTDLTATMTPAGTKIRRAPCLYWGDTRAYHQITVARGPAWTLFVKAEPRDAAGFSVIAREAPGE